MQRNADLIVDERGLAAWNTPERRRESFRNLHQIQRRGMSFRAPMVMPLTPDGSSTLREDPLAQLLADPAFCAIVIAQGDRIVFERYAADFGPDRLHSMQSITKTFAHLALGRLIGNGSADPAHAVSRYVPEAGSAYATATLQQVLDMDVASNFAEDYSTPYAPRPAPGAPTSYARQEIAMGWRLPPDGEEEFGVRRFAAELVAAPRDVADRATLYASPNTDLLGWIIERASGAPLANHVEAIIGAAGLESSFHISVDCAGTPVLSGGGMMTARDLARYGLLLGRETAFMADARSGRGTAYGGSPTLRYRNHLMSNGRWIGHPGYAGQFLMVDPDACAAAAFYSVVETEHGDRANYFAEIISALQGALEQLR